MIIKLFNSLNIFLQIKILSITRRIRLDGEKLYVYKNKIPKIIIDNISINDKIKEIGLYEPDYNTLKNISAFRNLEELCIRFFQSDNLPEEIWKLKKLKKLKLDQCEVSNISSNIKNLNNLEYLNLSCKIKTLTPEIYKLKKLKVLNLKRSYLLRKITKLPENLDSLVLSNENLNINEEVFCLVNLKKLEIENTPIKKIPDSIANCKNLYHLSVHSCVKNFELSSEIGNLSKLDYLELSGKAINNISFEFTNLKNLKNFIILNTSIIKIPDSICSCFKLKNLIINDTPIEELPINIGNLRALSKLDLVYTNINKLRRSISNLKKLEYLYLPEGVNIPLIFEEKKNQGNLKVRFDSHFDESSFDEDIFIKSFSDEFGKTNRAKDIWLFE